MVHTGADVRIGCEQDSPLHAAVRGGEVNVVELLMDYGADGSWRNAEGKTPLDLAPPNSAIRNALQKKGTSFVNCFTVASSTSFYVQEMGTTTALW